MRCRKAQSLTSAYSSDELEGRRLTALREHLAVCAECRSEAQLMRTVIAAGRSMSSAPLSDDFNRKLLDRIARERFTETRTKPFFPRLRPVALWPRVAAVSVTFGVVLFSLGMFAPGMIQDSSPNSATTFSSISLGEDDSYLTAQPSAHVRRAVPLKRNWSLNEQLALSERISHISNKLTSPSGFSNQSLAGSLRNPAFYPRLSAPYSFQYIRIRPVFRGYRFNTSQTQGGSKREY